MTVCILPSERQKEWGWAASANFFFGGTGAGYYLVHFWLRHFESEGYRGSPAGAAAVAAVLMLSGLICVAWEAGRPVHGYQVFIGMRHSWMSREILCFFLFLGFVGADLLVPASWCRLGSLLSAAGFVASQAMVVHASSAVDPWRSPFVTVLVCANALVSGIGMVFLMESPRSLVELRTPAWAGLVLIACHTLIWVGAVLRGHGHFWVRFRKLPMPMKIRIGLGRVIPFLTLSFWALVPANGLPQDVEETVLLVVGIFLLIGSHLFVGWMIHDIGIKHAVVLD